MEIKLGFRVKVKQDFLDSWGLCIPAKAAWSNKIFTVEKECRCSLHRVSGAFISPDSYNGFINTTDFNGDTWTMSFPFNEQNVEIISYGIEYQRTTGRLP
jgi:hypothetical protein